LFEGTKAIGVEYLDTKTNETHKVFANKEVICSLGSIGSPQLLMCSGVGPAEHLKEVDVDVVVDSQEVGSNLQDHLEFYMQYHCTKPVSLYPVGNWMPTPWYRIMVGLEWFVLNGGGLAGSNQFETGGFIRTRAGIEHPNIQYHFIPGAVVGQSDFLPYHAFQAHCGTLRPASRGAIRLKSKDPRQYPLIDPNYLSTEEDIVELRDGLRLTDEIIRSEPFDEYRGEALFEKDMDLTNDASVDEWIRTYSHSAYHPSSTCAMGRVTDSAGRVKGVESLRIVDASIMPSMTSGNLNAPTIMLAEKIADHVLGKPQLPKEDVKWWTHPEWKTKQR
jgi:choline dehydrogenase